VRFVYSIALLFILPLAVLRLFLLGFKNPDYRKNWYERLGFINPLSSKPIIWLHAVSVGETNAAAPLLNRLLHAYPDYQLLVTTVTPTGRQILKMHFDNDIDHLYFPYDIPWVVNRFLQKLKPAVVILMETEIWPNLCYQCNKENIPVLLINARLSKRSFKRYQLLKGFIKKTLNNISMIAAQTQNDANHFIKLGVNRTFIQITGNMKFETAIPSSVIENAEVVKRYFNMSRPVWIAASTQEGEEELILEAHKKIVSYFPNAVLILAARHPERNIEIQKTCKANGFNIVKWSEQKVFSDSDQVYLLDTLGKLQTYYAASQVAYVGGSLVDRGGQNMLEPAKLGLPILAGPSRYNFKKISEMLENTGALITVNSADDIVRELKTLFTDANLRHDLGEAARQMVINNQGQVDTTMKLIQDFIK